MTGPPHVKQATQPKAWRWNCPNLPKAAYDKLGVELILAEGRHVCDVAAMSSFAASLTGRTGHRKHISPSTRGGPAPTTNN